MHQIEARRAAKPLSFSSSFFFFLRGHIYSRTKVELNTTQNVFSRSRSSLPVSLLSFMSQTLKYCLLIFFLNSIQKFCVASLLAYMLFLWLYRQCFCVAFFGSVANVTQHCSLLFSKQHSPYFCKKEKGKSFIQNSTITHMMMLCFLLCRTNVYLQTYSGENFK